MLQRQDGDHAAIVIGGARGLAVVSAWMAFCTPARPSMRSCVPPEGSIVNIASMSGSIINRGAPHASAAKAAVVHLSKAPAVEWAGDGIRVNSISPGYTLTEMTLHNPPELNAMCAPRPPEEV